MLRKIIRATQKGLQLYVSICLARRALRIPRRARQTRPESALGRISTSECLHDIPSGLQDAGREQTGQIGSVLRPSESRERPEARAEPSVEDILVSNLYSVSLQPSSGNRISTERPTLNRVDKERGNLTSLNFLSGHAFLALTRAVPISTGRAALGGLPTFFFGSSGEPPVAGIVDIHLSFEAHMIHGALMAPPQLSRDAPVVDVCHPVEVALLRRLGPDLDLASLDRSDL